LLNVSNTGIFDLPTSVWGAGDVGCQQQSSRRLDWWKMYEWKTSDEVCSLSRSGLESWFISLWILSY